jgi:hypothetical protein
MSRIVSAFLVILLALCLALPAQAQTTQRPLSDFLSTQGKYPPDFQFVPPDPNFLGWATIFPADPASPDANRGWLKKSSVIYFAGVDYALLAEAYETGKKVVPDLLDRFNGTITERPLPNGRAEVTIILHTTRANAWVIEYDLNGPGDQIPNKPTLFGHRPLYVFKQPGLEPALADTSLHVKYIGPANQPIPDLVQLANFSASLPGYELTFLQFIATAKGPLTKEYDVLEGTPGKCSITETGLFRTSGKVSSSSRVAYDIFPVENIKLQVVGK